MKSDRRHQLETNDLAEGIATAPNKLVAFWNRHGNKILWVFVVAAVAFAVYRYQSSRAEASRANAAARINNGRIALQNVTVSMGISQEEFNQTRAELELAINETSDVKLIASAISTKGRLLLEYARAERPDNAQDLIASAEADFNRVLALAGTGANSIDIAESRFALAVIAEQRGQAARLARQPDEKFWSTASDHYRQIIDNKDINSQLRDRAQEQLSTIETRRRPIYFAPAKPMTLPSDPTSLPSISTRPATAPTAPASLPATRP